MSAPAPAKKALWEQLGGHWPNREFSHFVQAAGLRWHVQQMGQGPVLLLVHGTGAANHTWRELTPQLSRHFTLVAPDLPGHGFTELPTQERLSLPAMAQALGELLKTMKVQPIATVGHSAGAAILARACLDGDLQPRLLISLNGAFLPLSGFSGHLFSPLAKLFATGSIASRLIAWRARDRTAVERLLRSTGSTLDTAGIDAYWHLVRDPDHIAGVLGMMAQWDLRPLLRSLPLLEPHLLLIVGTQDKTIPATQADRVLALLPSARLIAIPRLGHLAHEEQPAKIATIITDAARAAGVLKNACQSL